MEHSSETSAKPYGGWKRWAGGERNKEVLLEKERVRNFKVIAC